MTAKKAHTDTMILDVVPLGFCTGTELLNTRPHSNQIALPMVKDGPPGSGGTKRQGQKVKTDSPVPFKPTSTWADKFQLRLHWPVKPQPFHRWFFQLRVHVSLLFFFFFMSHFFWGPLEGRREKPEAWDVWWILLQPMTITQPGQRRSQLSALMDGRPLRSHQN